MNFLLLFLEDFLVWEFWVFIYNSPKAHLSMCLLSTELLPQQSTLLWHNGHSGSNNICPSLFLKFTVKLINGFPTVTSAASSNSCWLFYLKTWLIIWLSFLESLKSLILIPNNLIPLVLSDFFNRSHPIFYNVLSFLV